jgi:hypothetical protein
MPAVVLQFCSVRAARVIGIFAETSGAAMIISKPVRVGKGYL